MQRLVIRNLQLAIRSLKSKVKRTVSYAAKAQECVSRQGADRAYAIVASRATGTPSQAKRHADAMKAVVIAAQAEERARLRFFHATGKLGLKFGVLMRAWTRRVKATRVAAAKLIQIEAELIQPQRAKISLK